LAGLASRGVDVSVLHVDRLIGLVWDQLRALGLGRGAIEHRVKRGLLHPLHQRVYSWGPAIGSPWVAARSASLACGDNAVVSHHAAGGLLGIRDCRARSIDVTTVGRRVRRRGIRCHVVGALEPADIRTLRGIPVTSPARTLLDLAAMLTTRELSDALEQAQIKRLVTKQEVVATIDRSPRRPGAAALRVAGRDSAFTRSQAERRLVFLLRAAKLPPPAFNARVEGFEVDALWWHERVVLEFDSYAFHATRVAFERDRRRTAALQRARYVVLRTTWNELTEASHALVARTAEALALSAGSPTSSPARAGP
jgi:very-short-patch-repair endonuclease